MRLPQGGDFTLGNGKGGESIFASQSAQSIRPCLAPMGRTDATALSANPATRAAAMRCELNLPAHGAGFSLRGPAEVRGAGRVQAATATARSLTKRLASRHAPVPA